MKFDNSKTIRLFTDIILTLDKEDVNVFTNQVKERYLEKQTTDEPVDSYKITSKDLKEILKLQNV